MSFERKNLSCGGAWKRAASGPQRNKNSHRWFAPKGSAERKNGIEKRERNTLLSAVLRFGWFGWLEWREYRMGRSTRSACRKCRFTTSFAGFNEGDIMWLHLISFHVSIEGFCLIQYWLPTQVGIRQRDKSIWIVYTIDEWEQATKSKGAGKRGKRRAMRRSWD